MDWRTNKIYSGLGDGGGAGLDNGDEMADSANYCQQLSGNYPVFKTAIEGRSSSTRNETIVHHCRRAWLGLWPASAPPLPPHFSSCVVSSLEDASRETFIFEVREASF